MTTRRPPNSPIEKLDNTVINQIAAGEVVERPSHLVKELVENSLDAGSTQIEVEYDQGGRSVRVTDNGFGITKEDLSLALARHATSKISKADDLWNLHSFGFRGEALASIAAVSRVEIVSRVAGEQAFKVSAEFGAQSEVEPSGGNQGTTITIRDLFENVPARLKFLKSESAEHSQIKNVLKALALIHPNVEFRLRSNGKPTGVFQRTESWSQRASQVLEQAELFESQNEFSGIKVEAVFASPENVSGQTRNIWVFVQNRWVQDRSLQAAILDAYRGLLMHGEYPIVAVKVTAPTDEIDVNIHPTKSQVKFRDAQSAFRAVHRCIREGLEKAPWVTAKAEGITSAARTALHGRESNVEGAIQSYLETQQANFANHEPAFVRTQFKIREDYNQSSPSEVVSAAAGIPSYAPFVRQANPVMTPSPSDDDAKYWSNLHVIGQAQLTYIVTQTDDRIVFVDQHAAHERVAFERLMKAWRDSKIEAQDFLIPLTINLSADQAEALLSLKEDLSRAGIIIDALGPEAIAIRSGPTLITETALVRSLQKLAQEVSERGGSYAFEKKISDLFATMACHSVVRAGQSMSADQMRALLEQMDEFPLSGFCPHGRPVSVEYPIYQLEKDFGRIV